MFIQRSLKAKEWKVMDTIFPYVTIGLVILYFFRGFEYYINGGSFRGKYWVLKCFWEDVRFFSLGGLKCRTERVREMVAPHPNIRGCLGGYSYEQIRNENRYEEIAKHVFGNGYYFWGSTLIAVFAWPLLLILIIGAVIFGNLWSMLTGS